MSHPTWVRGLKQCSCLVLNRFIIVAPYVGAWIETGVYKVDIKNDMSHPTWVRGLKPY